MTHSHLCCFTWAYTPAMIEDFVQTLLRLFIHTPARPVPIRIIDPGSGVVVIGVAVPENVPDKPMISDGVPLSSLMVRVSVPDPEIFNANTCGPRLQ
jgi:hypothetical protein